MPVPALTKIMSPVSRSRVMCSPIAAALASLSTTAGTLKCSPSSTWASTPLQPGIGRGRPVGPGELDRARQGHADAEQGLTGCDRRLDPGEARATASKTCCRPGGDVDRPLPRRRAAARRVNTGRSGRAGRPVRRRRRRRALPQAQDPGPSPAGGAAHALLQDRALLEQAPYHAGDGRGGHLQRLDEIGAGGGLAAGQQLEGLVTQGGGDRIRHASPPSPPVARRCSASRMRGPLAWTGRITAKSHRKMLRRLRS